MFYIQLVLNTEKAVVCVGKLVVERNINKEVILIRDNHYPHDNPKATAQTAKLHNSSWLSATNMLPLQTDYVLTGNFLISYLLAIAAGCVSDTSFPCTVDVDLAVKCVKQALTEISRLFDGTTFRRNFPRLFDGS